MAVLEHQVKSLVEDAACEEETRQRGLEALEVRLRAVEQTVGRTVAIGVGALGLLQIVLASLRYLH